jgi:superfamily II DNA or RNA helicase
METVITIVPIDASWATVVTEDAILREINDLLSAPLPKPPPGRRQRRWDYTLRLLQRGTNRIPLGIIPRIAEWSRTKGYRVEYSRPAQGSARVAPDTTWIDQQSWVKPLRPYQRTALETILTHRRGIVVIPTAGGKTAVVVSAMQWVFDTDPNATVLWLVPTLSLLQQMQLGVNEWQRKLKSRLTVDRDRVRPGRVLLTTWQGVYRHPELFAKFTHVFVDEVHQYAATALHQMMAECTQAYVRWGVTGTLPDEDYKKLKLMGTFGPAYRLTTTRQLIQNQTLAALQIQPVQFDYTAQPLKRQTYREETAWVIEHPKRIQAIAKLVRAMPDKRILILFQFVGKHGVMLHQAITTIDPDRPAFFINGDVNEDVRETIRLHLNRTPNTVLTASYGTSATGLDLPPLDVIILAAPTKSTIRVLQSIGRGLRKTLDKTEIVVYDVQDNLRYGQRHARAREVIYTREGFLVRPTQRFQL